MTGRRDDEDSVVTPHEFITKWRAAELKERSASQEHFIDLCRLLGEPTPAEADPAGNTYCFERGARRDTGRDGWADVWKRHHFAWEYKGKRANVDAAFDQLRQYALALENPPLLIVSDMVRFRIRTNWTNSVSRTHEFELDDLAEAATRDRLKWAFSDPERLRPGETRQALTERVAASFAAVAQALRDRGHDPPTVAHFVESDASPRPRSRRRAFAVAFEHRFAHRPQGEAAVALQPVQMSFEARDRRQVHRGPCVPVQSRREARQPPRGLVGRLDRGVAADA